MKWLSGSKLLRVLLDTHALLWWFSDDQSLSISARKVIAASKNTIVVSAASAWQIATKVRIGKLPIAVDLAANLLQHLEQESFTVMAVSAEHALRAGLLAGPHRDPFDRMPIAQAQAENMPLISDERAFDGYGIRRIW